MNKNLLEVTKENVFISNICSRRQIPMGLELTYSKSSPVMHQTWHYSSPSANIVNLK